MQNSESSEEKVLFHTPKLAQTTREPSQAQPQTQPDASAQTGIPTSLTASKGIIFKKILIILAVLLFLAILGLLANMLYNSLQVKNRDSIRKLDLGKISQALENYRLDTRDARYYPSGLNPDKLEKRGYLDVFPTDPKNIAPFVYSYEPQPIACLGECTGYKLTACLENKNDKGENTVEAIAPCTTRSYQVTNP